jgi:hypothetical protein
MKFCHACGFENSDNAKFCAKCGTPQIVEPVEDISTQVVMGEESVIEEDEEATEVYAQPEPGWVEEPPAYQPADYGVDYELAPKKKKRGCVLIALVVIVLLLAGLTVLHLLVIRPMVQRNITRTVEGYLDDIVIKLDYSARTHTETIDQEKIDDAVDDLRLSTSYLSLDRVLLEQDRISANLQLFGSVNLEYSFDVRVNGRGEIVLKDAHYPVINGLIFEPDYLTTWLENSLNEKLEDASHRIRAIQITDGEMFIASQLKD